MTTRAWTRVMAIEVALITVVMAVATRHFFFFSDDFLFLQMGARDRFSLAYLRRDDFGHFAPIARAIYWVVARAFPLDWSAANAVVLTMFVGCLVTLAAIARRMIGTRLATFVVVGWWGLAVFELRLLSWLTAAVHILPALLATLLSILFFLRWEDDGRRIDRWLSVVLFALALLAEERPLLLPLYLALLWYVVRDPHRFSVGALARQIRDDLMLWLPYAVVFAGALAYLLVFYAANAGRPSIHDIGSVLHATVVDGFLPGLVGGFHHRAAANAGWKPTFATSQVLGGAVLLALAAYSFTRRRAGRAWVLAVVAYVVNMVFLTTGRHAVFDARVSARDLQYYVEAHLFFCLAVGLVLAAAPRTRMAPVLRRVATGVAVALAVVVLAGQGLGARDFVRTATPQRAARAYVTDIRRGLARVRRSDPPGEILPLHVPPEISVVNAAPYDDHVTFLQLFPHPRVTGVDSPRKFVIDRAGHVRPVLPVVLDHADGAPAFTVIGSARQPPADGPDGRCAVPDVGAAVELPMRGRVSAPALFAALDYVSDRSQVVFFAQDDGTAVRYRAWPQTIPAGHHVAYVRLEADTAQRVYILRLAAGSRFCVRGLDVVSLVFADARGIDGTCPAVGRFGEALGRAPCDGEFGLATR